MNTTDKFVLTAYTHVIIWKHNEMSDFKIYLIPVIYFLTGLYEVIRLCAPMLNRTETK
jgi:hypothetical protein